MNLNQQVVSKLQAIHEFDSGTVATAEIHDAKFLVASMHEWPTYLSGKLNDQEQHQISVTCWFSEKTGKKIEEEKKSFPKRFSAKVKGTLREYIKGIGYTLDDCDIIYHTPEAESGS